MTTRIVLGIAMLILSITGLTGCGGGAGAQATLEQDAYASVEGLGDAAGDEAMFADAFVPGAAPKNRKDYAACGYQVVGEPSIDNDTASLDVKVFGGVHATGAGDRGPSRSAATSKESQQTWTLRRLGEEWKIETAPLG